eukprot:UN09567
MAFYDQVENELQYFLHLHQLDHLWNAVAKDLEALLFASPTTGDWDMAKYSTHALGIPDELWPDLKKFIIETVADLPESDDDEDK